MEFKNLLVEVKDDIGTITFNRPRALNALNYDTMGELENILSDWWEHPEVRGVVLTGAGRAFVAGADVTQFISLNDEEAWEFAQHGQNVFNMLEDMPKPVIAAVNGFALGGGCELALACDFIYATSTAKLGQPEVNLGIICGWGGTQRMARFVGLPKARELLYSGEAISAEEAYRIGLVNKVCAPDKLLSDVYEKMKLILTRGPLAVAETKKAMNQSFKPVLEEGLELERKAFSYLFTTEDKVEGVNAFLQKRAPHFQSK
ncbi:MAG: enoyl-CoA hydratase/isomerase family protein [Deltaproteobacteria bacterium]|nr:enoyl-CoA hydratase/isomerase family protein [Deltaproteobacteria bacterium]